MNKQTSAIVILLLLGARLPELPHHSRVLAGGHPVEAEDGRDREAEVEDAEAAGPGHRPRQVTEDEDNNIQREFADPDTEPRTE